MTPQDAARERTLMRIRQRKASASHLAPSHKAVCEICGKPCRIARADRFGNVPPSACSAYCIELALHRRAKAAREAGAS